MRLGHLQYRLELPKLMLLGLELQVLQVTQVMLVTLAIQVQVVPGVLLVMLETPETEEAEAEADLKQHGSIAGVGHLASVTMEETVEQTHRVLQQVVQRAPLITHLPFNVDQRILIPEVQVPVARLVLEGEGGVQVQEVTPVTQVQQDLLVVPVLHPLHLV